MNYVRMNDHINACPRPSIPGVLSVDLEASTSRTIYVEGIAPLPLAALDVRVTDPNGNAIVVRQYGLDLRYDVPRFHGDPRPLRRNFQRDGGRSLPDRSSRYGASGNYARGGRYLLHKRPGLWPGGVGHVAPGGRRWPHARDRDRCATFASAPRTVRR